METVTSKDGTKIAYDKLGQGPALVFVDGAFCFCKNGTTPMLLPVLSQNFTIYTYDRRGRGDSGNTEPYSVEREIEDLKAVIDAAGGSALVLGISSGAALALLAAARGLHINKLAMFEPPYVAEDKNSLLPPADSIEKLNRMVGAGDRGKAVKYYLTNVMGMPAFAVVFVQLMAEVWKRNMSVAHTLAYDLIIMGDFSLPTKVAATIKVPTLIISGEKSTPNLRKAAQSVAAAIPDAQHQVIGSMSHVLKPKLLVPKLKKFLIGE
jgi:pimeloyl-ACP methyl ester carboxylesterase